MNSLFFFLNFMVMASLVDLSFIDFHIIRNLAWLTFEGTV